MAQSIRLHQFGGTCFALGGLCTLVGSAIHPTSGSGDYHTAIAQQLAEPIGVTAAWLVLAGSLLISWGAWQLLDSAWRSAQPVVQAGARLAVIGSALLVVESAVELAMHAGAGAYAAGTPVPMVRLSETLYAGCLPALMLGALMVNLGSRALAPTVIRILGAVGMVAIGLAGPLVDARHDIALWPLYLGGVLACIWIVWAGVRLALAGLAHPAVVQPASEQAHG